MKTGEGKTLVSTLPVYLNALAGKGVHLITVNDYLATRDSEWMGQVHEFLGLSVGLVVPGQNDPEHKRAQYAADITYGTNNEYGFDYLRDNMALSRERQVQRGHHYAIVDEVDSILVDEARTPLIISGRMADAAKLYYQFANIVKGLQRDVDYEVDEEKRTVAPRGVRHREGRGPARHREPLRRGVLQPRAPAPGRPAGQGAVQAGQGLHHPARRGEDRRRVHRPHPGGPALVRGPAPGRRGQGGGEDQGGEPDPRHDHPPELLPPLRQARRHDRYGHHRGRRAGRRPTASTWCRSRRTCRPSASTRPTSSTSPRTPSSTRWSTTWPSATRSASPASSAPCRSRSPSACPGRSRSGASATRS